MVRYGNHQRDLRHQIYSINLAWKATFSWLEFYLDTLLPSIYLETPREMPREFGQKGSLYAIVAVRSFSPHVEHSGDRLAPQNMKGSIPS